MSRATQQLLPPEITWALVMIYPSEVMMTPVPMEAPSDCSDTTVTTEGFTLAYTSWAVRGWPWGSRQARRTPGSP